VNNTDMPYSIYSVHRIIDGKWELKLWIANDEASQETVAQREGYRNFLQQHYDCSAGEIAKNAIETIFGCTKVEIGQLCGPRLVMEKNYDN
jgi:hypothetical protein